MDRVATVAGVRPAPGERLRGTAGAPGPARAVEVAGLRRDYRRDGRTAVALDAVDLHVDYGEVLGVLGVNGAGKTTLIKILATLLTPTAGRATVAGLDVVRDHKAVRRQVSLVLGGDRGLYPRLSARDNLAFFGLLAGLRTRELASRSTELLTQVGLLEAADQRVETFSKGMRQRLHIAIGLVSRPRVLLLDEPTLGLDPEEAERFRQNVRALCGEGIAVILTSHYLLDIDRMADRVVMLHDGRISHTLTIEEFRASADTVATVAVRGGGPRPEFRLPAALPVNWSQSGDGWAAEIMLPDWNPAHLAAIGQALEGAQVTDFQVLPVALDDVFSRMLR